MLSVNYYDKYGRIVQSYSENYLYGYDLVSNHYDFSGNLVSTNHYHEMMRNDIVHDHTILKEFEYDAQGRLFRTYQKFDDEPKNLISELHYNELGQLIEKNLSCTNYNDELPDEEKQSTSYNFLQSIDYAYNIRGWLTRINSPDYTDSEDGDVFGMALFYDQKIENLSENENYNGNISSIVWSSPKIGDNVRAYGFEYDKLSRIKEANYAEKGAGDVNDNDFQTKSISLEAFSTNLDNFTVSGITYDLNGNIKNLNRNGVRGKLDAEGNPQYGLIDELTYLYKANALNNVSDAVADDNLEKGFKDNGSEGTSTEYLYDGNGNLRIDDNKHIVHIEYNVQNLPTYIEFADGSYFEFVYDASANKLAKEVRINDGLNYSITNTYYSGSFVYTNVEEVIRDADGDGIIDENFTDPKSTRANEIVCELEYILTDEGRINKYGATFQHEYFIKDHLGNTRVVFSDLNNDGNITVGGENNEVLQETNYYPFGMSFAEQNINYSNKYLYNGKELNDEFNLDWYDYGWRMYDPAIARFHRIDRFAEKYYNMTPYQYAANNPILYVDINGDSVAYNGFRERMNVLFARISSKEFRGVYKELKNSENTFRFINTNSSDPVVAGGYGGVKYNGESSEFEITYTTKMPKNDNTSPLGRSSLHGLFEESYHAYDYETDISCLNFVDVGGERWLGGNKNNLQNAEAKAWMFASSNSPFAPTSHSISLPVNYSDGTTGTISATSSTTMVRMIKSINNSSSMSAEQKEKATKNLLINGFSINYSDPSGRPITPAVTYPGPYNKLK